MVTKVGVGVMIIKDNKVLLGKRKNSHGDGSWSFPGGHLEFKESWEDCATRETMEETGIHIKNISFCTATNDIFDLENKHYVTIMMSAKYDYGEVRIMEPEKFEAWNWFERDNFPKPLFVPIENFIKKGHNPFK
ncbi:NUDIX domain-containing protein [Candidatus Gracilibacteria bacterium 28_42_T64]|nr:NUDIX domain-containing protein [Candidatus Gracilibacteria bacterium 28_42_T64]